MKVLLEANRERLPLVKFQSLFCGADKMIDEKSALS